VVYALFRHPEGTWIDARRDLPAVEVHYDDESPGVLDDLLTTRKFEAVWLCRTHNLPRVLTRLNVVTSLQTRPIMILDTEALASNRVATLRALNGGQQVLGADSSEIRSELRGAELFDCIVAVNEHERAQVRKVYPSARVALLSHEVPVDASDSDPAFEDRSGFLFVGSVHDEVSPNFEGLSWFVDSVWPLILAAEPDARLTIAGYWDARVRRPRFFSSRGVTALGRVQDLGGLYKSARVFVAPIRFAAGIPLKVQEAMSSGVPCAVTNLLAHQIGLRHGVDAAIAQGTDAREFARVSLELHRSRALWRAVREAGLARAQREWSQERFVTGIRDALGASGVR
jgi:glycosyltransferase involved in cell wall biosynthesis